MKIQIMLPFQDLPECVDTINEYEVIENTSYSTTISGTRYSIESLCMYLDQEDIMWTEI